MLRKIILHGYLRKLYGKKFMLDVDSPAEAVRALAIQCRGFSAAVRRGEFRVMRGGRGYLDEQELPLSMGDSESLSIFPVASGSKKNGLLKVILGVVLIGVGFAVGLTHTIGGGLLAGMTGKTFLALGAGMFLNGLGQMLSPTPEVESNEGAATKQSFIFGGTVNLTEEGNIIPVAYGKPWCGSLVLSAGMDVPEVL